jgi:hypothetical protein
MVTAPGRSVTIPRRFCAGGDSDDPENYYGSDDDHGSGGCSDSDYDYNSDYDYESDTRGRCGYPVAHAERGVDDARMKPPCARHEAVAHAE